MKYIFFLLVGMSLVGCSQFQSATDQKAQAQSQTSQFFMSAHQLVNQLNSGQVAVDFDTTGLTDDQIIDRIVDRLQQNVRRFEASFNELIRLFPDLAGAYKEALIALMKATDELIVKLRTDLDFQKEIIDAVRSQPSAPRPDPNKCIDRNLPDCLPVPPRPDPNWPVPNDNYTPEVCEALLEKITNGQLPDEIVARLRAEYDRNCSP